MISLIHPSRGRPNKASDTYRNWIDKASKQFTIQHILCIDADDPTRSEYYPLFDNNTIIRINDNNGVVQATNRGARIATGGILIYLSDDFDCPENWDKLISECLKGKEKAILRVNDNSLAHKIKRPVLTIPIMTRGLYEELGYFFYPEYKSMCCDNDLYFITKQYLIEASDLVFPHLHYSEGQANLYDGTYQRSEKNYNQGAELFNKRAQQFGWPMQIKMKE